MSERLAESRSPDHRIARLTVDQYHRMIDSGILREGEPIELLDGVLVYKDRSDRGEDPMTVGKRHALAVQYREVGSAIGETRLPHSDPVADLRPPPS